MKKTLICFGVISLLMSLVLFLLYKNHRESDNQKIQSNTDKIISSDFLDLSRDYVSSTGEKATVAKNDQNWRISYRKNQDFPNQSLLSYSTPYSKNLFLLFYTIFLK